MKASSNCINLIKKFEGCRLVAYSDAVGVPTIGYGHTKGVKLGMKITQAQAEKYLADDLAKYEKHVSGFTMYQFNQNQFDALVSFAYNVGNINQLTSKGTRTIAQISAKIPAYNKAGGKVLAGLTKRRKAEKELFDKAVTSSKVSYYPKSTSNSSSLVVCLELLGIDSTFKHRKEIAIANGIKSYSGTASQNSTLLKLLKEGKLVRE